MRGSGFMKWIVLVLIIACAAAMLSGCVKKYRGKDGPVSVIGEPETDDDTVVSEEEKEVTEEAGTVQDTKALKDAVNTFNWNYFDNADIKENMFYSPYSLERALAVAAYGAGGQNAEQMKKVLNIKDMDMFLNDCGALLSGYGNENGKFMVADSLWIDKTFNKDPGINEDYVRALKEKVNAEVKIGDFAGDPEGVAKEITKWVSEKTDGLISDYSPIANDKTVMDILNAVYFSGEWEHQFMKEDTFEGDFNGTETGKAEMMSMMNESFRYYEDDIFKGIELPYKNSSMVMDIVLPVSADDIGAGEEWKGLTTAEKEAFIDNISDADMTEVTYLQIPKFSADITAQGLKETLKAMGMEDAFDPGKADFSGIAKNLYVSDIAHRAKIEVDEEGSRAAAVTEMEIAVTAIAPVEDPIEFICDHPFVYVIRDSDTGVILFTGLVNSL